MGQKEDCITSTFSQEPIPSICSELPSSSPAASPPFREPLNCTLKICASHDADDIPQYSSRALPQICPSSLLSLSTLSPSALLSAPYCVAYLYGEIMPSMLLSPRWPSSSSCSQNVRLSCFPEPLHLLSIQQPSQPLTILHQLLCSPSVPPSNTHPCSARPT